MNENTAKLFNCVRDNDKLQCASVLLLAKAQRQLKGRSDEDIDINYQTEVFFYKRYFYKLEYHSFVVLICNVFILLLPFLCGKLPF
jgi:hypothetical protein